MLLWNLGCTLPTQIARLDDTDQRCHECGHADGRLCAMARGRSLRLGMRRDGGHAKSMHVNKVRYGRLSCRVLGTCDAGSSCHVRQDSALRVTLGG
eukprot:34433-Eustigmatos_ZCMA.PRE.1